jgi:hypothetical protein
MLQMSSMMGEMGAGSAPGTGPPWGAGGFGGFGGLANPTATPDPATDPGTTDQAQNPRGTTNAPGTTTASPPPNPLLDPALLQQLYGGFGGGLGGGPFGAPAAPTDTRPPEERFQTQLQVCIPHDPIHWPILTLQSMLAIERDGFRKCLAERPRPSSDKRERPSRYRVHPWRRRLVSFFYE